MNNLCPTIAAMTCNGIVFRAPANAESCSLMCSVIVPRAPCENWNTFYAEPEDLSAL